MQKYYYAYDERYKRAHSESIRWFSDTPTSELLEWINDHNISLEDEVLEVGCGEGRDAIYLSSKGYKVTAVDVSEFAILKCKELAAKARLSVDWKVADALYLEQSITKKYKWIYSIGTLHMLVDDRDRDQFLNSIFNLLEPNGKLLIVSMGDGKVERKTDTSTAFEIQERSNNYSGKKVMVTSTSYRAINWKNHEKELKKAGFVIEKKLITENHEYGQCMTVYLSRN